MVIQPDSDLLGPMAKVPQTMQRILGKEPYTGLRLMGFRVLGFYFIMVPFKYQVPKQVLKYGTPKTRKELHGYWGSEARSC